MDVSWRWPKVKEHAYPKSVSDKLLTAMLDLNISQLLSMTQGVIAFSQGQDHRAHITKFRAYAIFLYCHAEFWLYFTQSLSMANGCAITLTQGYNAKVEVTLHTHSKTVWAIISVCRPLQRIGNKPYIYKGILKILLRVDIPRKD